MDGLKIGLSLDQINEFHAKLDLCGDGRIHYSHIIDLLSSTQDQRHTFDTQDRQSEKLRWTNQEIAK